MYNHILYRPCGWSWCDNNLAAEFAYNNLTKDIRALVDRKGVSRSMLYYYNKSTLHVTIATLMSFKLDHSAISNDVTPLLRDNISGSPAAGPNSHTSTVAGIGMSEDISLSATERRTKVFNTWAEGVYIWLLYKLLHV